MKTESLRSIPEKIDIQDVRRATDHFYSYGQVLASECIGGDKPIDIQLRSVAYRPTVKSPSIYDGVMEEPNGNRIMFGIFADNGLHRRLIQLVSGPSEFIVDGREDKSELRQEKKILAQIAKHPSIPFIAEPLPNALQTSEAIYGSTAPGIVLRHALDIIAGAYHSGELSKRELTLLLRKMHTSALVSLGNLHSIGIKHNHSHIENFNIDIRTGNATIFDYTYAVSNTAPDTIIHTKRRIFTADNFGEDIAEFQRSWREYLKHLKLDEVKLLSTPGNLEVETAIAKLAPTVIRAALYKLDVSNPSEEEIERIMTIQDELIGIAPTVRYPKNTFRQRLKTRLVNAKASVSGFISA